MRVFESVAPPSRTIKYIDQVVKFAPDDIEFIYFSWFSALFRRWDVFHVHWPEFLVRSKHPPLRWWRMLLLSLLITRIRLTRRTVVRTVHNLRPHEAGPRAERRLLARLDKLTTWKVVLNTCTPSSPPTPQTTILHGDYRHQFDEMEHPDPVPGRVVFFGRIEPYKGVLELVDSFEVAAGPGESLRIVGQPTREMAEHLERRRRGWSRGDATIEYEFAYVSDQRMVDEIGAAEVVVLPYREMHNSGVALVSLSMSRPIVVPSGCVNQALAQEVGEAWVVQYEGDLGPETLSEALRRARVQKDASPDLRERDWRTVSEAYAAVYRDALAFMGERRVARW